MLGGRRSFLQKVFLTLLVAVCSFCLLTNLVFLSRMEVSYSSSSSGSLVQWFLFNYDLSQDDPVFQASPGRNSLDGNSHERNSPEGKSPDRNRPDNARRTQEESSALSKFLREQGHYQRLYQDQGPSPLIQPRHVKAMAEAQAAYQALPPKNLTDVRDWLGKRDIWSSDDAAATREEECLNCAINASCYNATINPWHPSKCQALKDYRPESVYLSEKCFNLSALILGDSRGRFMLMGILRRFYPEWIGLNRFII